MVAACSAETASVCNDKHRTSLHLRSRGIAAAASWLPGEVPDEQPLPLFVKPRRGRGGVGAFAVRTRRELDFFLEYVEDAVVQDRAYSDDPAVVSEQAVAAMSGLSDAGLISSPKHFPGHGSVSTDSHVALPVQQTPLETLKDEDWAPFQAAVDAGAPTIMMGHIAVSDWNDQVPATLEPKAYRALRDDLGFHGSSLC